MPERITLAHDPICPWCWIALFQTEVLSAEFGIEFDWVGYELFPDELEWPDAPFRPEPIPDKPATPGRLALAYAASGVPVPPKIQPHKMRSHNVLEALEEAKKQGVFDAVNRTLYRAYWLQGREINKMKVLKELTAPLFPKPKKAMEAVEDRVHAKRIVPFDDTAHERGVWNVPTFFIGEERLAEQPTQALRDALRRHLSG
ncbi:MAG: DsbA family protein [Fimbriimonadaceae bacterium]|nr:DsbA family protein [Fimbriimonadaceae bacterium]